jgi:hypothetical protein
MPKKNKCVNTYEYEGHYHPPVKTRLESLDKGKWKLIDITEQRIDAFRQMQDLIRAGINEDKLRLIDVYEKKVSRCRNNVR